MTISDFDGAQFWPAVKAFVIASGVEPISLGEPEDEIWRKIFAAMQLSGTPLSLGMTPGELMRQTYATVTGGGRSLLRVVANRNEQAPNFLAGGRTSGNVLQRARLSLTVGTNGVLAGCARINASAYYALNGVETNGVGHKIRAHLEVAGVAYPVTWGGASQGNVPAGAAEYLSDQISGHPDIEPGTDVWVLLVREYNVGEQPIYMNSAAKTPAVTGETLHTAATGVDPGLGTPGALTASGGWTLGTILMPPMSIVGDPKYATKPAIAIVGASIERGTNDAWGDGVNGAGGYIRRGLITPTKYSYVHLACAGEAANQYIASTHRRNHLKYADAMLIGYGGNDYTNGRTAADTLADIISIANQARAVGITRIGFLRMAPKSDSTDGWVTTGNQTPRAGFIAFRNVIDAGVVANGMTLVDVTSAYETGANTSIWKANLTTDGTHPQPGGHSAAAPLLETAMGALLNDLV